jgi:hypothetical protein
MARAIQEKPKPTYHTRDFRTYPPELVEDAWGQMISLQLCETLENGRWESFYTTAQSTEEPR